MKKNTEKYDYTKRILKLRAKTMIMVRLFSSGCRDPPRVAVSYYLLHIKIDDVVQWSLYK